MTTYSIIHPDELKALNERIAELEEKIAELEADAKFSAEIAAEQYDEWEKGL